MMRWGTVTDSTGAPGDSGWGPDGTPHPTDPPVPMDYTMPVDFTRFAVIVLRAGPQERWGGGIWLTDLHTSAEGTRIAYAVVEPGPECPPVGGTGVEPTVAIRVPLPLPGPISWERGVRTIDCDWGQYGDSTGTRPPMPPMH